MAIKNMFKMGKKDEGKKDDKPKCGMCPKCNVQTSFDENSGYCYCPKCQQMYSPAGTK
jgi:hypothetical protein